MRGISSFLFAGTCAEPRPLTLSLHHWLDLRLFHYYAISYPCTALHEHFFFKVIMKILASKMKLSINLKYMQVQGKGKGNTNCDQTAHKQCAA